MLAVIAAAVLFGTTGTSQALGPDGTTPLGVGAVRLLIGGTALAALGFLLARRHRARPGARPGQRAARVEPRSVRRLSKCRSVDSSSYIDVSAME